MLVAEKDNQLVFADEVKERRASFSCPGCHQKVIFRHGKKRISHFAHCTADLCGFSEGETAEHLLGKKQLYSWAKEQGWQPQLEVYLPEISQRPDILVKIGAKRLAIEFQCSPLSLKRLCERNEGYRQENISVIWLLGSPYRRKLGVRKVAQFTEFIQGQPFVLFWNVKAQRLERRTYYRCSYSKERFNQVSILTRQISQLAKSQYLRPNSCTKQLSLAVESKFQRQLAQCPLVCHDLYPTWPTIIQPVVLWRIHVVLTLASFPLFSTWKFAAWEQLLVNCGNVEWVDYGCVDGQIFRKQLVARFTNDLLAVGIIIKTSRQIILIKRPSWVLNPQQKIAFWRQQHSRFEINKDIKRQGA